MARTGLGTLTDTVAPAGTWEGNRGLLRAEGDAPYNRIAPVRRVWRLRGRLAVPLRARRGLYGQPKLQADGASEVLRT